MRALIASELAPSPSAAPTPLEKKYFSSNVPRGQDRYLLLVTRLTVLSCMAMLSATSRKVSGFIADTP